MGNLRSRVRCEDRQSLTGLGSCRARVTPARSTGELVLHSRGRPPARPRNGSAGQRARSPAANRSPGRASRSLRPPDQWSYQWSHGRQHAAGAPSWLSCRALIISRVRGATGRSGRSRPSASVWPPARSAPPRWMPSCSRGIATAAERAASSTGSPPPASPTGTRPPRRPRSAGGSSRAVPDQPARPPGPARQQCHPLGLWNPRRRAIRHRRRVAAAAPRPIRPAVPRRRLGSRLRRPARDEAL
jgi:hypothetical protein